MRTPSPGLDLRLLLPALVAWAFTASVLAWSLPALLVVAGVALVLSALLLVRGPSRSRRSGRGDRG
ncbi:MAG: hypothetical protein ABJA33_01745, partial [Pedococcus sp.]